MIIIDYYNDDTMNIRWNDTVNKRVVCYQYQVLLFNNSRAPLVWVDVTYFSVSVTFIANSIPPLESHAHRRPIGLRMTIVKVKTVTRGERIFCLVLLGVFKHGVNLVICQSCFTPTLSRSVTIWTRFSWQKKIEIFKFNLLLNKGIIPACPTEKTNLFTSPCYYI